MAYVNKHTCIDKSELKSIYWKQCHDHRHTQVGNEASSKVYVGKPVVQDQIIDPWD